MKIINFINPVSPQEERSCKTWFRVSLTLLLATVACITYMQVAQLIIWSSYRQEYKKYRNATKLYAQVTEEKKKLTAQELELKNKLNTIINGSNQCCKLIEQLNALHKACTQNIHLSSCSLSGDGALITINCPNIEQAQACVTSLTQSRQFADLRISSICPVRQSMNVILKTAQNSDRQHHAK